jgi:hypothetical protein
MMEAACTAPNCHRLTPTMPILLQVLQSHCFQGKRIAKAVTSFVIICRMSCYLFREKLIEAFQALTCKNAYIPTKIAAYIN